MAPKTPLDMDRQDIQAAVRKTSYKSMAGLARAHGLASHGLDAALTKSAPRYEAIIAAAIGKTPQQVWPSRFTQDYLKANPWRRSALRKLAESGGVSTRETPFGNDCTATTPMRNVEMVDGARAA